MRKTLLLICFLAFAAQAAVRLPPFTRKQLPNGTVVYLIARPGVPLVGFRIVVKGGFESEPEGKAGIGQLTAELLRRGTGSRTADQFSSELDLLGGTFDTVENEYQTAIASEFLKKDFERGLALTADAVLHPAFPEAEFQKTLAHSIDSIRSAKDNPLSAIPLYFRAFFYGASHPYGRVADDSTLGRITRSDVAAYHDRQYTGKNLIVVVSGDFDAVFAAKAVAAAFGSAPVGEEYRWSHDVPVPSGRRLLLINKPDATQTYFSIGQPGIRRTDPDRTALMLVNTLFGGRFTSMLNDELRVNTGLTYGAFSTFDQNHAAGATVIRTYTRTESTTKAMDLALDVLDRLVTRGVTAEQLASAKAYVKGTYPPQYLETSDQIAARLGELELFGLNRGEVDDLFSRVDAVTLEQANAVARKRYGSKELTFVVLGNAAKIRDEIKKHAPGVREISIQTAGFRSAPSF